MDWFSRNQDLIFFIYGLAFLAMGASILVQRVKQVKGSIFRLADVLWLLAWFGVSTGVSEFINMWLKIRGGPHPAMEIVNRFIGMGSYVWLFEFGRQLIHLTALKANGSPAVQRQAVVGWRERIARLFQWWLTPAFAILAILIGLLSADFSAAMLTATQYLYVLIGGLATGLGFSFYYTGERKILEPLDVRPYFVWSMISFIAFGILGGLIISKPGDFFLSQLINTTWFVQTVKIPVEVFLALSGIVAAVAIGGILNVFNWERTKQLHMELEREKELARMDSLTGIANIRAFNEIAGYEITRSKRYKHPISMAYLDVDNFKYVNDTFGHSTGNTLLSVLANIIYNNIRVTDMVCRVGGDEFVVLFTETGAEQAKVVINKIQKLLLETMQKNGWPVTFSIGAVTYVHSPNDVETILKASDEQMYYAKRNGKNQIKFEVYGQK